MTAPPCAGLSFAAVIATRRAVPRYGALCRRTRGRASYVVDQYLLAAAIVANSTATT
jgi:hypothetical protein